jgi:uncharacterized GH25 family protein
MIKRLFVLAAVVLFSSHDMYLKLDTFFLPPNTSANIQLFNGTFDKSENAIARNRMIDISLVGNGTRSKVDTTQWSEQDNMTILSFKTGEAGTWVAGVSTRSRDFAMDAAAFNEYLEHDGVIDMLKWRKGNNALDQPAVERYSKHVKTIFQVGETRTDDWQTVLDYPIEFVPLSNPYDLHAGDMLKVKLLLQGKPLIGQLVYVDSDQSGHGHDHAAEAAHEHGEEAGHDHAAEAAHEHGEEAGHDHAAEAAHEHGDEAGHDHAAEAAHEHGDEAGHDHAAEAAHEYGGEDGHDHAEEAGHEHGNEAAEAHHHDSAAQYRTDARGEMSFKVSADGIWNLRTIYMVNSDEPGLTHESNWATLTFEVDHGQTHEHAEEGHSHAEEHEAGIPGYVYWGGSLVLLAGLFFWFNRKD